MWSFLLLGCVFFRSKNVFPSSVCLFPSFLLSLHFFLYFYPVMYLNVLLHLGLFAGLLCPLIFCLLFLIIEEDYDFSLGFYILRISYCLSPFAVIQGEVWEGIYSGKWRRERAWLDYGQAVSKCSPSFWPYRDNDALSKGALRYKSSLQRHANYFCTFRWVAWSFSSGNFLVFCFRLWLPSLHPWALVHRF